jgi:hypothetical protein
LFCRDGDPDPGIAKRILLELGNDSLPSLNFELKIHGGERAEMAGVLFLMECGREGEFKM